MSPALGDQEFRTDAMRAGLRVGWLSIAAVLVAVALGDPSRHVAVVVGLTLAAAVAHTTMAAVPWSRWLGSARGRAVLDLWTGGLIAFATLLVVVAGARARFDLLLFLVAPFIAVAHDGRRRAGWLVLAAAGYAAGMALAPDRLALGEVALHAVLLAAAVVLALTLAAATRREAAARADAAARAALEHALLAEAHHRVKNSLQTVADLLLLGRPADSSASAFDQTATRIRSIAAVHHLLAGQRGGSVRADELLCSVVGAAAPAADGVTVDAEGVVLDAARAQQLGVVANELVANAVRHGAPPVTVRLRGGDPAELVVEDAGAGPDGQAEGLGLQLVRQIAEHGLGGRFVLVPGAAGGARAELRFPLAAHAHPDR